MVYLIISDLHSNLEALEKFSEIKDSLPHDKLVCLGDMVGYCANPNEILNWVRKNADIVIAGNHDHAAIDKTDTSYFNAYALKACHWTRDQLTKTNQRYLDSLPVSTVEDDITWSHSSPFEPEEWHYVNNKYDGKDNFPHFDTQCCFIGHTHQPQIFEENASGQVERVPAIQCKLKKTHRYLINVGSLGQPRDGNPNPSFGVLDTGKKQFSLKRFEYPLDKTQEKILENGLPEFLAQRLVDGQ